MSYHPTVTPEFAVNLYGRLGLKFATVVPVLGKRTNSWSSTVVLGDVAQYLDNSQALINPGVLGTNYYLRSSSTSDTALGTGVRSVRITYLDAYGMQKSATISLNGTTSILLGNGFLYFQWVEIASAGSAGMPVGNITIANVPGVPLTSQIVELVQAGNSKSFSARYKVPADKFAYIVAWGATGIGGQTFDVRLMATTFADNRAASSLPHTLSSAFLGSGNHLFTPVYYLKCPPLTEIKASAIPQSSAAANKIDVNFDIILINL